MHRKKPLIYSATESPRTILFIHSSNEMYGADVVLLALVKGLDKTKFRPIVVIPTDVPYNGLLSKALQKEGVKFYLLDIAILRRKYFTFAGMVRYLWRLILSVLAIIRLIQLESVDIIHNNTLAVIPGAIAARLTNKPSVWHVHEMIISPRFLWKFTSWLAPRLAERVVAVSTPLLDHLCTGNPLNKKKAIVIHNGVDITPFVQHDNHGTILRKEWGVFPDQVIVGMVGRFNQIKGQKYFLNVAGLIAPHFPEARFAMVGGAFPGQEQIIEEIKLLSRQLSLSDKLIISDFRNDIADVLHAFDILVLPSVMPDSFPTVILEAMAAKKPVVANALGGCTEMVKQGETGFLVTPGQPNKMAELICALITNPLLRLQMGENGLQRINEMFSFDAFIKNWSTLYDQL